MFPLSGTWFTAIGLAFFFHGCDLVCQGKLPSAYQGQRYPPFLADPPPYLSCSVTVIWRAKLTCNPVRPSSDSRHAHLLLAVLTIWENLSTFSIAPVKKSLGVYLIHFFLISDKQPMSKYCWLYTQHLSRMWPLFTTWIAMTSDPSAISHIGHSIAFLWVSKLALQFLIPTTTTVSLLEDIFDHFNMFSTLWVSFCIDIYHSLQTSLSSYHVHNDLQTHTFLF